MEILKYTRKFDLVERKDVLDKTTIREQLEEYSKLSIAFTSSTVLEITKENQGYNGIRLSEVEVEPFTKNYDDFEPPSSLIDRWSLKNWALIKVVKNDGLIAGAIIAWNDVEINMLRGREDLAVFWDLRMNAKYRKLGIGTALFNIASLWAKSKGCSVMHIETQNINVPACKFYAKMGCNLIKIDTKAYSDLPEEVQLVWEYNIEKEERRGH